MRSYTLGYRKAGRSELRRDKRLRLPVFSVRIANQRYDSINWSLGGMLLGNYDGHLFQGLTAIVNINLKSELGYAPGEEDGLTVEALVIRHDLEKRELALKFQRVTPALLDFFERSFNFHHRPGR
jgi:hypothetical protein